MNDQCEPYEVLISTWMDEGLERGGQRELFDHFVRCDTCRAFYRDVRTLEGLAAAASPKRAAESGFAEQPSAEVWERIESGTVLEPALEPELEPAPEADHFAGLPAWALRAAAVLAMAAALAFLPWPESSAPRQANQVELILEENRGSMTEVRFLELATELLRSDRRYHFAMQEVIEKVIDDEWDIEGATSEGLTEESKSDEGEGESSQFRV